MAPELKMIAEIVKDLQSLECSFNEFIDECGRPCFQSEWTDYALYVRIKGLREKIENYLPTKATKT